MNSKVECGQAEYFGRKSVILSNEKIRAVVEDRGGMVPEFSLRLGKGGINAHWVPDFRENSGAPWSEEKKAYWKSPILYGLAGDFPCMPNFGPDCVVDGVDMPAHGWAANGKWHLLSAGKTTGGASAVAHFGLESPDKRIPLRFEKFDIVAEGQPAYYSVMKIKNNGTSPISINVTRHNTLGGQFLQKGCKIYLSASHFMTAPKGTEFDDTGRLAQGVEFDSLGKVPLRTGGYTDIGVVPGMVGATDFVTGAVAKNRSLGWSCVVNPALDLAYVAFFPGRVGLADDEIALSFNDLWLQYGGRNFTPWSFNEGGADRTFCLGTENAVGAFASGLPYSREHPELLGNPTLVEIPAGGQKTLCYGVALIQLDAGMAGSPVADIEPAADGLVIKGASHSQKAPVDASFGSIRALAKA